MIRTVLCLANSRKYRGRCIAVKTTDDIEHVWMRPISGSPNGELDPSNCLAVGSSQSRPIHPLDVVEMDFYTRPGYCVNPEDCPVHLGPWKYLETATSAVLSEYTDSHESTPIPRDPNCPSDRLSFGFVESHPQDRTLWLVHVDQIRLASRSYEESHNWHAQFQWAGVDYDLGVTDDEFTNQPRSLVLNDCYLCLSLGLLYGKTNCRHFLVASIIP
jgi:hypothetical protein